MAALMLGLATALGMTGLPTPPAAAAPGAYGWCYYGSYSCYNTACAKARYLQNCGYCTKIRYSSGYYFVYYL
jgi:hypothetical protein